MALQVTPLVSNGCMIQRDKPVTVWGGAEPGRTVTVILTVEGAGTKETSTTVSDESGRWQAVLPAHPAGDRARIVIDDGESETIADDVLFGDVWILAGQSNMEMEIGRVVSKHPGVLDEASDEGIRVFNVPQVFDFEHEHDELPGGSWIRGDGDVSPVSAIGYFFARHLREHVGVPVGLIGTSVGGSMIETWMSRGLLETMGALPHDFARLSPSYVERQQRLFLEAASRYDEETESADPGVAEQWQDPAYDDSSWRTMALDEYDDPELAAPGVVWLRKRITVPDRHVGRPAQLRFGTIADADRMYLDGEPIGETFYQYPPREYDIASLPKTFTLALRIRIEGTRGGFTRGKRHVLVVGDGLSRDMSVYDEIGRHGERPTDADVIDVDAMGPWRFRRSLWMPAKPVDEYFRMMPVGDYNAMIVPLRRLGVTGVLWYQGESNCGRHHGYADLQMAMVREWRGLFSQGDVPFIYAQLPNYRLDGAESWPALRDEQRRALASANSAMVTTYDIGADYDLHPVDKYDVAERMGLAARAMAYGERCEYMGPSPASAATEPGRIVIGFDHASGGLRACGPLPFEVTGLDGTLGSARLTGRVSGRDRVVIDLPDGADAGPATRVRFLWEPSPEPVLTNGAGLPATPFDIAVS